MAVVGSGVNVCLPSSCHGRRLSSSPAAMVNQFCCVSSSVISVVISDSPFIGIRIRRRRGFAAARQKRVAGPVLASQETSTSTSVSTLLVQEVEFIWKGPGSEVLLSGDFLKWETQLVVEKKSTDVFSLKQKLPVGKYSYKFIVDGEWKHSPDSPSVPDGAGGFNNELIVTDPPSKEATKVGTNAPNSQAPEPSNTPEKPVASKAEVAPATALEEVSKEATAKTSKVTDNAKAEVAQASPPKEVSTEAAVEPSKATDNAKAGVAPAAPPKKVSEEAPAEPSAATDNPKAEAAPAAPPKKASQADTAEPSKATDNAKAQAAPAAPSKPAPKAAPKAAAKAVKKSLEATMVEDVIPLLMANLGKEDGISELDIVFEENQLKTSFAKGDIPYCFWAFFPDGTLDGSRGSALTARGSFPSTIEPFLIDEKKITPDIIVFWIKKRLFVQNILATN